MQPDAAAQPSFSKLTLQLDSILNASLNGIIACEAVRDGAGTVVDFTVISLNSVARQVLQLPATNPGWRLLAQFPGIYEHGSFAEFIQVVETGESLRFETPYGTNGLVRWFEVSVVRMGDGFVVTFHDITQSRHSATVQEQQNELLQSILNTSLNNVFVYEAIRRAGPDGQPGPIEDFSIRLVNSQARQDTLTRLGVDPTGRTLLTTNPDSRQTGQFDLYCQVTDTGQTIHTEQFYPTAQVWFNTSITRLNDGCVVTGVNITAQKLANLAIERQADLLNSVLNSSQNGIMSFEAMRNDGGTITDFRFVTINQASETIVGVPLKTMQGSTLLTLFPGNVESGLFDLYVHTTHTGEPTRTEVYYNHDGLDFWLDISARKLGDGFVVTFTDTSVVKRAAKAVELAAAASERQADLLNTVLDNSQTAISLHEAIRDPAGQIIDFQTVLANSRSKAMWGELADAIMSKPFFAVASLEQQTDDFPRYVRVIETGEPDLAEFSIGGQRYLRLTAKSGDGIVISNIDITEIYRLRQQLEASVVDLQRSNANLEQFAYVASHDLQEPLRKIQAFGDIITAQYAPLLGPQGTDMIERMQSAAARMQMLIKDVLAYSRIATRRENSGLVDLNELVKDVLDNLETAIAHKQAIVTIGPLPTVVGDAPQLRQLLQNLLSNALKFSKPGGIPQIGMTSRLVRGSDAGMAVSTADAPRQFHLLELHDNGIGFEPHHAERIFQVFQRLHSRSNYEGTGIGLAIVHKVVENHQGYVEAEGKPGRGAAFRILWPVADGGISDQDNRAVLTL